LARRALDPLLYEGGLGAGNTPADAEVSGLSLGTEAVDGITQGFHVAQLVHDTSDAVGTLVRYFRRGLALNEFCLWVVSDPVSVALATSALQDAVGDLGRYLDRGQLRIADAEDWYHKREHSDMFEWLRDLFEASASSNKTHFDGMRLGQNVSRLSPDEWADFMTYQEIVKRLIRARNIATLSCYHLGQLAVPELVDVVNSHSHTLCQRRNEWELIGSSSPRRTPLVIHGSGYASIGRNLGVSRERVRRLVAGIKSTPKKRSQIVASGGLLSSGDAASLLGVSINTISRWHKSGDLPAYRIGSRGDRRFKRADVEALAARRSKA
jgi:excisionase family DNA binding protein